MTNTLVGSFSLFYSCEDFFRNPNMMFLWPISMVIGFIFAFILNFYNGGDNNARRIPPYETDQKTYKKKTNKKRKKEIELHFFMRRQILFIFIRNRNAIFRVYFLCFLALQVLLFWSKN